MIPVVRASGTPTERGTAIGRGLAEPIGRSAAFYERYFGARDLDTAGIRVLSAPFLAAAEERVPGEVAVLRAMAASADVAFEWLFAANAFEELDPLAMPATRAERCTSFVRADAGGTILGHTEQWLAGDLGCVAIVIDDPGGGAVPVVSPVVASWLPAVGVNAAGGAVSVMSLTAPDDGVGVPRVLVSRHALGARDPDDAVRRATVTPRSGGYAYLWGWPGGRSLCVETSATRHATVEATGHANHCLDPSLAAAEESPSEGSLQRSARACALVEAAPPGTLGDAMAVLSDHEAPICVHPDPAEGDEADCIVFAMAVDVDTGELWVADGNPCEGRVERFEVRELLADG